MNKIAKFLNARISGFVTDKPEILAAYSRDASILEIMPKLLFLPNNIEDIQYVLRFTNKLAKKGYQLPIAVRGSGLDQSGADLTEGMVLSTEKMNQIQEIDERGRLVRVQAGVTLGQLNSALALFGLYLPVEADPRETIGGLISNFYTDRIAKKYGSIYYYVDRLEVVLANGELFQSLTLTQLGLRNAKTRDGLVGKIYQKTHKIIEQNQRQLQEIKQNDHSRIGYRMLTEVYSKNNEFDLAPLFFGAQGSLGVITELILKVAPIPRPTKKALFLYDDLDSAIDFMERLKKLEPVRIDFYDTRIFSQSSLESVNTQNVHGSEDTKVMQVSKNTENSNSIFTSAKYLISTELEDSFFKNHKHIKKMRQLSEGGYKTIIDQKDIVSQFEKLAKLLEAYRNDAEFSERVCLVDRSYIPAAELNSVIGSLAALEEIFGQPLPLFGSFATNLYSIRPAFDLSSVNDRKQLLRFIQHFGKLLSDSNGTLCGGSAEGQVQALIVNQEIPTKTRALYHEIKQLFDPNNILAPKIKQHASLANVVRFMRTSPQIGLIRRD